jgi:2-polyprenyl-3-methyl-5-hydroxy-6-metoxy-1,4-benzoquinol methylase
MSADRSGHAARYHIAVDDRIAELLRYVEGYHRVLEIGCSAGHVSAALKERGHYVYGIEIDPVSAATARTIADMVKVADLDRESITTVVGQRDFDALIVGDVLEHLREPAATLREALTLLAPHAVVALSLPNVGFHDVRTALLEGEWTYRGTGLLDETHLRFFTRRTVFGLAHDAGLVVTDFARMQRAPGTTNVAPERPVVSTLIDEYLSLDPNAAAYQFVARLERPTDDTVPLADELARRLDAEEADALLQLRQVIATYERDQAALLQLRRDFIDLSNSRMVRWGSMPRRAALALRRLAGRVLRALRLRPPLEPADGA